MATVARILKASFLLSVPDFLFRVLNSGRKSSLIKSLKTKTKKLISILEASQIGFGFLLDGILTFCDESFNCYVTIFKRSAFEMVLLFSFS